MNYNVYIGAYRDFKEILVFYSDNYNMPDDVLEALKNAFKEALNDVCHIE